MSRIDTHRAAYNKPHITLGKQKDCPRNAQFVKIKRVNDKFVVYEHKPGLEPYVWLTTSSQCRANLLAERLRKSAN